MERVVVENPPFNPCFSDTMTQFKEKSPSTVKVYTTLCFLFSKYGPDQNLFVDIRELRVDSWRNAIGIVPQDPILFTGTIASNIAFGNLSATREQIEDAAREANCEFVWGMPKGFDTESAFSATAFWYPLTCFTSSSWPS